MIHPAFWWALLAIAAAIGIFVLGWSLCRQAHAESAVQSRETLNTLISASKDEADLATRMEQTAARFEQFRETNDGLRREVSAIADQQNQMFVAMIANGILTKNVDRVVDPRRTRRSRFSGAPPLSGEAGDAPLDSVIS